MATGAGSQRTRALTQSVSLYNFVLYQPGTSMDTGASKSTPGDAKCVTQILGARGGKNKVVGGQSLNVVS